MPPRPLHLTQCQLSVTTAQQHPSVCRTPFPFWDAAVAGITPLISRFPHLSIVLEGAHGSDVPRPAHSTVRCTNRSTPAPTTGRQGRYAAFRALPPHRLSHDDSHSYAKAALDGSKCVDVAVSNKTLLTNGPHTRSAPRRPVCVLVLQLSCAGQRLKVCRRSESPLMTCDKQD